MIKKPSKESLCKIFKSVGVTNEDITIDERGTIHVNLGKAFTRLPASMSPEKIQGSAVKSDSTGD